MAQEQVASFFIERQFYLCSRKEGWTAAKRKKANQISNRLYKTFEKRHQPFGITIARSHDTLLFVPFGIYRCFLHHHESLILMYCIPYSNVFLVYTIQLSLFRLVHFILLLFYCFSTLAILFMSLSYLYLAHLQQ